MLRQEMLTKEFELDAELKMYEAAEDQGSIDLTLDRIFTNRCRLYGWRNTYGDKLQRQSIKDLQKKIIDLEMKEIKLRRFIGDYKFKVKNLENDIAVKSVQLPPPLHEDPADRVIVATALAMGASLVTKDKKLLNYSHVPTIW